VLGVYRWVPELQATLIAEMTEAEALQSVNQSQMVSVLVMLGASMAALLL
jgi:hypothetical protein